MSKETSRIVHESQLTLAKTNVTYPAYGIIQGGVIAEYVRTSEHVADGEWVERS